MALPGRGREHRRRAQLRERAQAPGPVEPPADNRRRKGVRLRAAARPQRVVAREADPEIWISSTAEWRSPPARHPSRHFSGANHSFDPAQDPPRTSSRSCPSGLAPRNAWKGGRRTACGAFDRSGQGSINGREMNMSRIDELVEAARAKSERSRTARGHPTTSTSTTCGSGCWSTPAAPRPRTSRDSTTTV